MFYGHCRADNGPPGGWDYDGNLRHDVIVLHILLIYGGVLKENERKKKDLQSTLLYSIIVFKIGGKNAKYSRHVASTQTKYLSVLPETDMRERAIVCIPASASASSC